VTKFVVHQKPHLGDFVAVCTQLPQDEREQFEAFTGETFDPARVAAAFSLRGGPAWVVTADDEPIIVAGFDMIRPGVWQDWLFSTPKAWDAQHWRSVTKICKKAMDALLRDDAHRLQCVSLASRIHAHRWYRPLGLTLEGTLRGYGVNGEDALMFSRLRTSDNG
jgi:hypothetical protein